MACLIQKTKFETFLLEKESLKGITSEIFAALWGHWNRIFEIRMAMTAHIVNLPYKSFGNICLFTLYNL